MTGNMGKRAGGRQVDVAIIGAGPAGLTAGYLLTKAGRSVAIIEKDPQYVGGMSRTEVREGYRFDIGGHPFSSNSQRVVDLWNEILPDDFIERPRLNRIRCDGKFYNNPPSASETLRNLGLIRSAQCLASFAKAMAFPNRDVRSFEDWAINQFGREFYSIFVRSCAEKVWGKPCDEIGADWAVQRIGDLSPWSEMAVGTRTNTLPQTFHYPRLGPGMMWEAARDKIVSTGRGEVLMGHALKQLADDGQGGWRLSASGPEGECVIAARHAISSAPMRDLAARLHPLPASAFNAEQLRYRELLTVALMIRGREPFADTSLIIQDSSVKVERIQNLRAWSPEMVPETHIQCVGLEYLCSEGDDLWSMADDRLSYLAISELQALGLADPKYVVGSTVVRQEKAFALHDEQQAANVAAVRGELEASHPTLHLVGRTGMHRNSGQDHAMLTALQTVENILAGERIHDVWSVDEGAEHREAGDEGAGRTTPARWPARVEAVAPDPARAVAEFVEHDQDRRAA